jgi:hypothetical protein
MTAPLKRVSGLGADLEAVQANVAEALRPLREHPFADGELLADANGQPFLLKAGQANRLEHGLQRKVRWFVVSQSGAASIYELASDEVLPERILSLRTSLDVSAFIFVFPA